MMGEHEKQIALMEAELAATEDAFFAGREEIDTHQSRNVFGAGFRRAWAYLKSEAPNDPGKQPATTNPTRDENNG